MHRSADPHRSCIDRSSRMSRASIGPSAVGHESRIDWPIRVSRPWSAARSVVPHESCIGPSAVQLGRSSAERTGHGRAQGRGRASWPIPRVVAGQRTGRDLSIWPSARAVAEKGGRAHGPWPSTRAVIGRRAGRGRLAWPSAQVAAERVGRPHGSQPSDRSAARHGSCMGHPAVLHGSSVDRSIGRST